MQHPPGDHDVSGYGWARGSCIVATIVLALAVTPLTRAQAAAELAAVGERAIELYDRGSYAEAQALLEQIDAAGAASGPMLYRLYFCRRVAEHPQAQATLERARTKLEIEASDAAVLEIPFYLVNAYQNLGLPDSARLAAEQAIERVATGGIPQPATALEKFRLAKLHADLGRVEDAATWYEAAISAFGEDERYGPYRQWAARFLAEHAPDTTDHAALAARYLELRAAGTLSAAEHDRGAVALARLGRYAEAADAWRQAELANIAEGDRARYARDLALMAVQLGGLPERDPAGTPFVRLGREQLETLLRTQAERAGATLQAAQAVEKTDAAERERLKAEMRTIQGLFVAAALEYTLDGHDIRATAFTAGFAPLIRRRGAWRLSFRDGPPDPPAPGP
jgi:tetratricopeptide (TPR) repeat protein